jgi:hypothetical protein
MASDVWAQSFCPVQHGPEYNVPLQFASRHVLMLRCDVINLTGLAKVTFDLPQWLHDCFIYLGL